MRVSWLSDGVRAMMSLAADIAFRAARLNKRLGEDAARQIGGIVMIDEVDLHLHPTWQQQVLGALRATFPKLQFIVTTHSPQVLSSVHNTHIRTLDPVMEGEFIAATPLIQTLGATSLDVLQGVMGTPIRAPGDHTEALTHLEALVAERRYEEATRRLEALKAELGADHAQLARIAARLTRYQQLDARARGEAR
jgi:predicted ATP-binding protein involved in virulence